MTEAATSRVGHSAPGFATALLRHGVWLPSALLVVAFALGGVSAGHYLQNYIIQILAIVTLGAACTGLIGHDFPPASRFPLILLACLAVLMLWQVVPLPYGLWSSIADKEVPSETRGLLGLYGASHSLSVDPDKSILSALALLPGAAMAVATMRLNSRERLVLAWIVVVGALLSLVFGAFQAALGDGASKLTLYDTSHLGLPLGFFANINHQADLLVIGMVFASVLAPSLSRPVPMRADKGQVDRARAEGARAEGGRFESLFWIYGLMIALGVGVIVTGSRAGMALMVVAIIAIALRNRGSGHAWLYIVGGFVLALGLLLLITFNTIVARSLADFSNVDDPRFHFWPNVVWAIGQFGIWGTGAGTFDGIYRSAETLDSMTASFVNHAHNEYLEIALEMGIAGIALVLAFFVFLVRRAIAIIRRPELRLGRALSYAGLTTIGLILLHSAVDYPLRTPLLSVLFGLACGLIVSSPLSNPDRPENVSEAAR